MTRPGPAHPCAKQVTTSPVRNHVGRPASLSERVEARRHEEHGDARRGWRYRRPADRARRVWCRPEATIGAPGSSCVFVSSVAPCFNLLRTSSGSQLIPDRTSARLLRDPQLLEDALGLKLILKCRGLAPAFVRAV